MKTTENPSDAQAIFALFIYFISFKLIKTRALKARVAEITRRRWEKSLEIQKALDAEHSTGRGICFIDGKTKSYTPYTAARLHEGTVQ